METLIKYRWICNRCSTRGRWKADRKTVQKLARRHMRRPGHHYMELEAVRQYRSSLTTTPTAFTMVVSHTIYDDVHIVHGFENLEGE